MGKYRHGRKTKKISLNRSNRTRTNTYTMKKLILIISIAFLACNSHQSTRYVCTCEQQKQLQNFVKESIKPANNMSDEEMEDVISQLRKDGIKLYCNARPVWVLSNGSDVDWEKQKFDSCETIMSEY